MFAQTARKELLEGEERIMVDGAQLWFRQSNVEGTQSWRVTKQWQEETRSSTFGRATRYSIRGALYRQLEERR